MLAGGKVPAVWLGILDELKKVGNVMCTEHWPNRVEHVSPWTTGTSWSLKEMLVRKGKRKPSALQGSLLKAFQGSFLLAFEGSCCIAF